MYFGSKSQLRKGSISGITISSSSVPVSSSMRLLGVTFDQSMSFNDHVADVCRSAQYHLRALRHIRNFLDPSSARLFATALVGSKLDYCNFLCAGMSQRNIHRLQRVQNSASRIVLGASTKLDNNTGLKLLHWLPVSYRIDYKVSLLIFKTLTLGQPAYLNSLLDIYVPPRDLRSASNGLLLTVPRVHSVTASRSFSVFGPQTWNSLPKSVRDLASPHQRASVAAFKTALKTALFAAAFGNN